MGQRIARRVRVRRRWCDLRAADDCDQHVACAESHQCNRRMGVWLLFTVLTVIATAGFTSQNFRDAMAGRASVIIDAPTNAEQRARAIDIAQRAADTATMATS